MWHDDARRLVSVAGAIALGLVAIPNARAQGTPPATAKIVRPRARVVSGGRCLNDQHGTLGGVFGPSALPPLAFTIGPRSAMADQMHASKAAYTGPGKYRNVIVMVYLGKTALEDTYGGLGTVTVNADSRTGSFVLNDGSAAGTWDCGQSVR